MEVESPDVMVSPLELRGRVTENQLTALLEFMESHGDLYKTHQGAFGRYKADCLWKELANTLNSIDGGVQRTPDRWRRVWTDWKSNTKKKVSRLLKTNGKSDGPSCNLNLTAMETRLLKLIGAVEGLIEMEGLFDTEEQISFSPATTPSQQNDSFFDAVFIEDGIVPEPSPPPLEVILSPELTASASPITINRRRQLPTWRSSAVSSSGTLPPSPSRLPSKAPSLSPHSTVSSNRRHQKARRRGINPFDRATNAFVVIEQRRLRLDEMRERNEAKRIEVDRERNNLLSRFADIAELWLGQHLQNRRNINGQFE